MNVLNIKEVKAKTKICQSKIYLMMNEGTFPKSIKLGAKSVGWIESEIDNWIQDRINERDEKNNAA